MSVLISCPACGNQGELPAGGLGGAFITCRGCGVRFSPNADQPFAPPEVPPTPPPGDDGLAVWVGAEPSAPVIEAIPLVEGPSRNAPEITAENAAGHLAWLRAETQRFTVYVDRQLGALGKIREQVAAYEAKSRAEAVTREQALNRERTILEARANDLAKRETELAAALTRQGDELAAELGQLVATERGHLARRAEELMSTERSLQLRMNEVEELEQSLRLELDERELAVERQRRVLEDVAHELRTRTPPPMSGSRNIAQEPQPVAALACG